MTTAVEDRALALLHQLTGRADARFHDGQLEAIEALVADRRRVLVVQRTGWGKSAVYFIATRLLRDDGAGPTLLVSPPLALMRNQIEAAERMGVRARTINSSNVGEWTAVIDELDAGEVDLLLISPERMANRRFRDQVLDAVGPRAGLVVVDEAHCISDWGHDFRPDYRRIRRVLDLLPRSVPVLACTATANDRVVDDVVHQLGDDLVVLRGPLGRDGLALSAVDLPSPARRLAWLATVVPRLEGTGIIYCLTVRDVATVAGWLRSRGIAVAGYTGASDDREATERALLDNEVKAVVATSALGMGFDKPDLAFVVHYQAPGSPIAYYQQVGRAGRQLDRSHAVLLRGAEDRDIQDWFISRAFPAPAEAGQVLGVLEASDGFVTLAQLEARVNVAPSRIELLMKNLEVDGAVVADGRKYQRTANPWTYDEARVEAVTELRRAEQAQMAVVAGDEVDCRMAELRRLLDDPDGGPCGVCDRCVGPTLPTEVDEALAREASAYLRRHPVTIEPRKRWSDGTKLPDEERIEPGRAVCRWNDGGWGDLVRRNKRDDGRFDDELVDAAADLVDEWGPDPAPTWVTAVPSRRHPALVPDVAARIADRLGLPFVEVLAQGRDTRAQHTRQNSAQQHGNVAGAFTVTAELPSGPVLLVDDTVESRWTLTEVGAVLRRAGCPAVLPLALANAGAT